MKNIDKIRAMSAEELASLINEDSACGLCIHRHKACTRANNCWQGVVEWLNQEDDPMPILKIRDIVETVDNRYVVLDNNIAILVKGKYCEKQPAVTSEVNEIIKNETISYIWRYSTLTRKFEKIWRADNDTNANRDA